MNNDYTHIPERKKCLYCGSENFISEKRCVACGSTHFSYVTEAPATVPSQSYQQSSNQHPYVDSRANSNSRREQDKKNKATKPVLFFIGIVMFLILLSRIITYCATVRIHNDPWEDWEELPSDNSHHCSIQENVSTTWFDFKVTGYVTRDMYTFNYLENVNGNMDGKSGNELVVSHSGNKLYVVYLTISTSKMKADMNNFEKFLLNDISTSYTPIASNIYGDYTLRMGQSLDVVIIFETKEGVFMPDFIFIEQEGDKKGTTYSIVLF